ncbi:hypothetical protein CEXT_550441, partial [Caerostris extrusa]
VPRSDEWLHFISRTNRSKEFEEEVDLGAQMTNGRKDQKTIVWG